MAKENFYFYQGSGFTGLPKITAQIRNLLFPLLFFQQTIITQKVM